MKSLKYAIEQCDFFGERVEFYINKKHRSQTLFAGLLSICLVGMMIAAAWTIGNDIFYKNEPMTDTEDRPFSERPQYTFNASNFPISFSFQDYDNRVYDIPKYFQIEILTYKTFNANFTTTVEKFEHEKCTYKNFPNLDKDYLESSGMLNYLCVKNQNISIGGYWDNEYIKYAVLRFRLCDNKTDATGNFHCAPQQEINDFITKRPYGFTIYFISSIVNTKSYLNPIKSFLSLQYKNIRISSSKFLNIFIREQDLITDTGFIFEDFFTESSFTYDYSDSDDYDASSESLMDINLIVANHKLIYRRKYVKIQTILANLGGLFKAMSMAMYFLTFYFSTVKMDLNIINKNFGFDGEGDGSMDKNTFIHKTKNFNATGNVTSFSRFTVTKNNLLPENVANSQNNPSKIKSLKVLNLNSQGTETNPKLDPAGNASKSPKYTLSSNQGLQKNKTNAIGEESIDTFLGNLSKQNESKKLRIDNFETISMIVCLCNKRNDNKKHVLYQKVQDHVKDLLDISKILKKLEEGEKLKFVLLNLEQLAMFKFIPKPNFENLKFNRTDSLSPDSQSDITNLNLLYNDKKSLLKILVSNEKKSLIMKDNHKLYNMMSNDVKMVL